LLALVLALGCLLRLFRLTHQGLWFDEVFSVTVAGETDLFDLAHWMTLDVHPLLYYLCLHPFLRLLGDGPLGARSFSALCGCLTLIAMPWVACDLGLRRKGVLFATFLLSISPLLVYFSQEARMYALLALEALIAVTMLYVALNRDRWADWAVYLLATTASLYTHTYALLLLPAEALYLCYRLICKPGLPRRTAGHYLATMAILMVVSIPLFLLLPNWLNSPALGGARVASLDDLLRAWDVWGAGLTSLPTPGLGALSNPPLQIAGALLLGGLCLAGLFPAKRRPEEHTAAPLLAMTIGIPLLLGVLISWGLQKNFWAEKALTLMAPMVYLLAGVGAARLASQRFLSIVAMAFLAISLYSLYPHYFLREKSSIAKIVQPLREQARPADLVVLDPFWYVLEFDYAYREPIHRIGYYYYENRDHFVDLEGGYKNARLISGTVSLGQYPRIWVWGSPADIPRLCPYSPQSDFWYYDPQIERWQDAGPCPSPPPAQATSARPKAARDSAANR